MRLPLSKLILIVTAAAGLSAMTLVAAESPVGFRVIEKRDPSRPVKDSPGGRPIQIALWYPAASGAVSPATPRMRFGDYVVLMLSEKTFTKPTSEDTNRALAAYRKFLMSTGMTEAEGDALLATPMRAIRDAPRGTGRPPLILFAPGNGQSADDAAAQAERLAAHGFVVASVPSPTRISGPMRTGADIPAKTDEQASDLAFARRALREETRPGSVGVVGHSFGARSALLLAMRNPDVAGLVSLDGGIGSKMGKGMMERAPGFALERMTKPLLHFYEELDSQMAPDFKLLRSLERSDRWLVRVAGMHHVHFTSMGNLTAVSPSLARATSATPDTAKAWDAVTQATIAFFDASLNGRGSAASPWTCPPDPAFHAERLPASR